MKERLFKFKQFSVAHEKSAMKVGVDAVLLGAWANLNNVQTLLDVGCGCGVISLIAAQKNTQSSIIALDIDEAAVAEANENFKNSLWRDRLSAYEIDFMSGSFDKNYLNNLFSSSGGVDYIISNPPYFDDRINIDNNDLRSVARHVSSLSPLSVLEKGSSLLSSIGRIGMICPVEWENRLINVADKTGMFPLRIVRVKGCANAIEKRLLIEFGKEKSDYIVEHLTLEESRGIPTESYKNIVGDFYLKM